MSLTNFRTILLSKTQDVVLQEIIKNLNESFLGELILETMEKSKSSIKGADSGYALKKFGADYNDSMDTLARDALSHHASRYKAALKAGKPDVANKHMDKYMSTLNVLDNAAPHSDGKLHTEYVDPKPWERNLYLGTKSDGSGEFSTDTRGLSRQGARWTEALSQAPHHSYSSEIEGHGHAGAYPLEHNKINDKHIHIKDLDPSVATQFVPHPFDEHPVFKNMSTPRNLNAQQHAERNMRHDQEHDAFMDKHGEHLGNILDEHETQMSQNPEEYESHYKNPSSPVHDPVQPLDYMANKAAGIGQGTKGARGKAKSSAASSESLMNMINELKAKHGLNKPAESAPAPEEKGYDYPPEIADIMKQYGGK